ncbi:hypothetical protein E2C01_076491 [Portunus trituberculatus]|uniref:Uncharacterized protein n=1 Tax=Portunus trituberculatus TaxID=210409 RepID=A0A5B7IHS9_PORTR|nr:hypothetical protein [Portunus trituberculatus]
MVVRRRNVSEYDPKIPSYPILPSGAAAQGTMLGSLGWSSYPPHPSSFCLEGVASEHQTRET